jgi:hypothetical protein
MWSESIMGDAERTLVILFSMHRCGSSLTANVLERLGMSLGPFELNAAQPSNPHGHFEAVPFVLLNRKVQYLALGFSDDQPESPEMLRRILASRGVWEPGIHAPEELLEEGRSLVRTLVDSGTVSGFKDPRTVLTWPFWRLVLDSFPGLRVVPLSLIRSPHEIAMSLVTRRHGWFSYWTALDLIAVHLERQKAIVENWDGSPSVCFGSPTYLSTLEGAVARCGLSWNTEIALEVFDSACVHHTPASVAHLAQDLFDSLCPELARSFDPGRNAKCLESDARDLESLRLRQWRDVDRQLSELQEQLLVARHLAAEQQQQVEREREHARREQEHARREQEHARREQLRAELAEGRVHRVQDQLDESQARRNQLHDQLGELQARLNQAQDRERQAIGEINHLRSRLTRFELHPIIGPALRGRRKLRGLLHSMAAAAPNGD